MSTNQSQSDIQTLDRYQNAGIVDFSELNSDERSLNQNKNVGLLQRSVPGIPDGAEVLPQSKPDITFVDVNGNKQGKDLRVKILVPSKYLTGITAEIQEQQGIIFPYTPSIAFEMSADYGTLNPMHSNFSISFYQRSKISSINIQGQFSVQNEKDARIYMATMNCLKALTRMRSGGKGGDSDSGAPPPVCRLFAYGEMLENVPIAISNFRIELPNGVDYMTFNLNGTYSIPTLSTFAITCITMFSRNEMQGFSVGNYIDGGLKGKGFI